MDSPIPGSDTLSTAGLAFEVLLKLIVVVALIYVTMLILRRWQVGRSGGLPRQVTILESTRLSPRQALHLVRVGSQVMLIGATDSSLTLLSEEVELVDAETQPAEAEQGPNPSPTLSMPAVLPGFSVLLDRASKMLKPRSGRSPAPRI